jgi:ribose/xylose/arabinose/galactoside ABC-type transport system permease subunit
MMNMSVLAALAGMIFVARSAALRPQDGLSWELDAIAAVFIGGAAVSGGLGTISGSIVGGLVMAVLNNGLQLHRHRLRHGPDHQGPVPARSPSRSTSTTRARGASRSSDR